MVDRGQCGRPQPGIDQWDNTLRLWDVATGQERLSLHNVQAVNGDAPTLAAMLSPNGKLLVAAQQNTIRLWTLRATAYDTLPQGHNNGVLGLATSPDGRGFASASQDFTVKLWSFPGHGAWPPVRATRNG